MGRWKFGLGVLVLLAGCLASSQPAISQRAVPFLAQPKTLQALKSLQSATPFMTNDGQIPPADVYNGPFFKLNHAWPTTPLPPITNAPWQAAINNGPLTVANAPAYAAALKAAVAVNGRNLIMHYDTWDAAKAGWYNEPWLGSLREAIRGTYQGSCCFGSDNFEGLGVQFSTRVVTYYDARAAAALNRFWGASAMQPTLKAADAQFAEGSLIVKAASFASTDRTKPRDWWASMKGAQEWDVYIDPTTNDGAPELWPSYVAQFDIIVKDTQSSPRTGWVFMTLVYDASAPGDIWDKMVPLGVQWGNDPESTSASIPLKENWVNMKAPPYSRATLGWNGRLSGPNDGAANLISVNGTQSDGPVGNSSCMSCHSTSQWNASLHTFQPGSFLFPSFANTTGTGPPFQTCGALGAICSPAPGSAAWMKWFQDRKGDEPMDAGDFATDFDEVFAFKSLGGWWTATGKASPAETMMFLRGRDTTGRRFNQYNGAPIPDRK